MTTRTPTLIACGAALLLPALAAAGVEPRPAAADAHDFVFLGEARPVLVRLHVRADGRPLQAAWDDCIDYLFRYLDVNHDGVLTKDEIGRVQTADQVMGVGGGGPRRGPAPGGRGAPQPPPAGPTMEDLDTDHDGRVTRAELAAYYRKNGLVPFQFRFAAAQANPLGMAASILGGPRAEPSVEAVSKAIFNLLDTNGDGKLSKEELAAAPAVLLRLDEDDDEIVTPQELVPDAGPNSAGLAAMFAMGRPGGADVPTSSPLLVPVAVPGEAPADLARRMVERYGRGDTKVRPGSLGLDEAAFRRLDANGDGVLDAEELAGFVRRAPDLELVLRLGERGAAEARLEVVTDGGRSPLAGKLGVQGGVGLLDLGLTRAELRANDQAPPDIIGGFLRQQLLAQFHQADANGDGVLDAAEIQRSRQLRGLARLADRDGDGRLTEAELVAYLDHQQELQRRAAAGCVTLELSDQSRGLFDLLDTNRDGRLSVREMRRAPELLARLDRAGRGYLTREDVPRSYRLEVRRGPANAGGAGGLPAGFDRYLSPATRAEPEADLAGPLWFRKMDRNRDGDVSRREFLFGEALFRKLDLDGDGLISREEAEKADALGRIGEKEDRGPGNDR